MSGSTSEREMDRATGRYRSVVTYLEMAAPGDAPAPTPPSTGVQVEQWREPDLDAYLALFHRIGDRWLWHGRLAQERPAIARVIRAPDYAVWRLWSGGEVAGMGELDYSCPGSVELVYFGLVPEHIGAGLGGYFLRTLLGKAAQPGVERIWLHTCTEDHPHALHVYRRFGFRDRGEEVEWVHDPRLRGLLPRTAGPHVAIPE